VAKWTKNADFRRALSLGIQRDQLNETFWLGLATSRSAVPADNNKWHPGSKYNTLWVDYDPKQANEMLDKIGLDKKDSEGYRLRTDGKGRLSIELACRAAMQLQFAQMAEMIKEQWKEIGIFANVADLERTLLESRAEANELVSYVGHNDATEHLFLEPGHLFPAVPDSYYGPLWGLWYVTGGERGEKPDDPRMLELMDKFRKGFGVPEEENIKLGKEIWAIAIEEVYNIATVGLSPAFGGVRVVKTKMGNVPSRMTQIADTKTPSCIRPVTLYWKS
jgi:peptide/nickel transport system substrate-binding protein